MKDIDLPEIVTIGVIVFVIALACLGLYFSHEDNILKTDAISKCIDNGTDALACKVAFQ